VTGEDGEEQRETLTIVYEDFWATTSNKQLYLFPEPNSQSIATSFFKPWEVYTLCNVILNPVWIPPFLRVNLGAIELHGKVNMVTSGHSCLAAIAHNLAAFYHVTFMYIDLAKVPVDSL
jgi:hypothetical protein